MIMRIRNAIHYYYSKISKFYGPVTHKTLRIWIELNIFQTCHSMEMKNLDLTNKKSGFGGKNRDHGQIGYKKK